MGKEGKMMRKTMEKRRDFDIKEWKKWDSNGNGGKNRERTMGKKCERRGK